MKSNVNDCKVLDFEKLNIDCGCCTTLENENLPFDIQRIYYLYDVPSDAERGGHAHKELRQILIAVSGSFDVLIHDGQNTKEIHLNKPNKGLLIVPGIWRELKNFSSGSVCLVMASTVYAESDYIRDFSKFLHYAND